MRGRDLALRTIEFLASIYLIAGLAGCSSVSTPASGGDPKPTIPTITSQPVAQTVTVGQSATFGVTAAGTAPLSYQWQKNGANINGATSASYTTPATTSGDSGSTFDVVVSNTAGSVTSSTASLTVTLPPIVPAFTQTNGSSDFGFTWSAIPGVTYQVQYKTNLAQADWINLGDPITTTNPAASILDSFGTDPERFYRVQLVQCRLVVIF